MELEAAGLSGTGYGEKSRTSREAWRPLVPRCLCAARWQEAAKAGVAPPAVMPSVHEAALELIDLALLKRHALDLI